MGAYQKGDKAEEPKPLNGQVILNKREYLQIVHAARVERQGRRYKIEEDPERWELFEYYLK